MRGARGLMLIEVVVAALLVGLGLLSILAVAGGALKAGRAERAARHADALADEVLEELALRPSGELASRRLPPARVDGVDFERALIVTPVADHATLRRVRATVRWGERTAIAETLRSEREP